MHEKMMVYVAQNLMDAEFLYNNITWPRRF